MFEINLDYILRSDHAQLLIAFSASVVVVIVWMKKRVQKSQDRRMFRKRQNAGSAPDYPGDRHVQLEFDF